MKYINYKQLVLLLAGVTFIILLSLSVISIGSTDSPKTNTGSDAQQQLQDQLNSNPASVSPDDLAQYPDVAIDNWDKLDNSQKDNLFQNHLSTFKAQFSQDWAKKDVDVTVADGAKYDPSTTILTNPDGTTINLQQMANQKIQSTPTGVLVNGNLYQSADNIHGNTDGSVTADSAAHIQAGGTAIDSAVGVTIFPSNNINVGHASVIQDGTTFIYDAANYTNNGIVFSVGGAASVVSEDCLYFYDVANATFNITQEAGTISTQNPFTMKDCMDTFSNATPESDAKVTVNKFPAVYNISNTTLIMGNESVTANTTAMITTDTNGMACITLNPPGTYYHSYADMRQDFALYAYRDTFRFCIRKTDTSYPIPEDDNDGLVDLINNTLYLNGEVEYLRYPFREDITSFDMANVYDGHTPQARATLWLDGLYVNKIFLNMTQASDDIAVLNPAEYITIAENSTSSFFKFSGKQDSYNMIQNYSTTLYSLRTSVSGNALTRGTFRVLPENYPYLGNLVTRLEGRV